MVKFHQKENNFINYLYVSVYTFCRLLSAYLHRCSGGPVQISNCVGDVQHISLVDNFLAVLWGDNGNEPKEIKYSKFISMLEGKEFSSVVLNDDDYSVDRKSVV